MKVVLLDDAPLTRERLAAAVSAVSGVEVTAGRTCGDNAEALILGSRPDVVIVDVHAPGAMGLSLIRRLRSARSHLVVVALASSSSLQYRRMCHEAGASYYFNKVRDQDRLVEAIAEISRELS